MKSILILIGWTIFATNNHLFFESDIMPPKVKGGFAICTVYTYNYEFTDIHIKPKYINFINTFDSAGRLTECIRFDPDGVYANLAKYVYNDTGRLTHKYVYFEDELASITTYNYNSTKTVIGKAIHPINGLIKVISLNYDDDNRITEYNEIRILDSSILNVVYTYQTLKNSVEYEKYNKKRLLERYKYTFDSLRYVTELSSLDSNYYDISKIISWHDLKMNITAEFFYNWEGKLLRKTTNKYDSLGNKALSVTLDGNSDTLSKSEYIYLK